MRYRKLDANGDYSFGSRTGQFLVDSKEAVAQAVLTRLRLIAGEWFLDVNEGTPYFPKIMGHNTAGTRDFAIRERILGTQGVKEIVNYASAITPARQLTVSALVKTIYGVVDITTTL